ncbi:MAG: DUF1501 domain-containing protein [Planctomycetota bacterium]|nr:DUF1501 domain-containing protein [Planctomycetota bacterium]
MIDRRKFLSRMGGGLGGIALARMLERDHSQALGHQGKAKNVIQLFMSGAASQVDTFDYKPELIRQHGKEFAPGKDVELFQSQAGACMKSPWAWRQHGQSGKWVSDLVPNIARCADDIAFIHSMVTKSNVHGLATFMQSTGFLLPGFPSMGAWVSYGLGSLTDDLPTFVVLPDSRGFAPGGPKNWSAGFLPAKYQAMMIRPDRQTPIADLFPPESAHFITAQGEKDTRHLLRELNKQHLSDRRGDSRLDARVRSYELAAQLQLNAPNTLNIDDEPRETRELYGLNNPVTAEFGRRCLIARRLIERGVRFVQLWSGADNGHPRRNWDSHENIERDHFDMASSMDQPTAALIFDLKRRGLLDETIVHWTTEFGRMPCSQGNLGRDHNPFGFTNWLAGGGIKGGTSYGATDEWSYKAIENPTYCHDVHATMLWLLGIDHEKLTVRHNGSDRRLTDVHGKVIHEILA